MKRNILLAITLLATFSLQAQWVDDPATNTFLANGDDDGGEIYVSTDENSGNTFIQWASMAPNGWSPTLQCVDVNGVPQWGENGIHINSHNFETWSQGTSMVATADNACVTCFQNNNYECIAIKINADGSFAWGEQGISVFDFPPSSYGCSRTELVAGDDGGVWVLANDTQQFYLRYINADGTMNPAITISEAGYTLMYGQLTLGTSNTVFLTYEKIGSGMWYVDKQIWVAGYFTDGSLVTPPTQLMASQTFGMTYIHNIAPDFRGGGYVYIYHSGIGNVFNTYVFHFDANGNSTISNPNGVTVHSQDMSNYYLNAYAAVDPTTNDLIVTYRKTDAYSQSMNELYMNRITETGDVVWGEGILIGADDGRPYSHAKVDTYPDGNGFMVSYMHGQTEGMMGMTIEAIGYDKDGSPVWNTTMNSVMDNKTGAEDNSGFHNGQNIVAWINQGNGILYGQNIDMNGNMGPVEQPEPCYAPENLEGEYLYNEETLQFGSFITWTAPENLPLHYNLYRTQDTNKDEIVIEVPATETSYFDEVGPGNFTYRLSAVYESCESDYALTPEGIDYVEISVTGIGSNYSDSEIEILQVFTITGQTVRCNNLGELTNGLYIVKGKTCDGQIISRKIVINNK